jgi:hypothetical protein
MRAARAVSIFVLLWFSACSRTLNLPLPDGTPLRLVTYTIQPDTEAAPKEVSLQSDAYEYHRLKDWVAHNQDGWHQSFAASPIAGVVVHCGDLHLQFVDTTVFAFTPKGHFQKEIREDDYSFLKKAAGI